MLTVHPVTLQMGDKQKHMYDQIRRRIIKAYDAGAMTDTEMLNTGFHTMRRICGGTRAMNMEEDTSVKMDSVEHFIMNRLGSQKVLVYTFYKANIQTLCDRLRRLGRTDFATYTGDDTNPAYREEVKQRFLDPNSGLNILIGTDAIRVGLNLQSAMYILMLDLIMNAQEMVQLIGRVRRMGSDHPHVVVYPLITQGTVEESLFRSLKYESALFDAIFDQGSDAFPRLTAVELATMMRVE